MPHDYTDRILRHVSHRDYQPQKPQSLARAMGIAEADYARFRQSVKALMKGGRIVLGSKNAIMLPALAGKIVGIYRANPRGFGFVVPDTPTAHGDLYIPPGRARDTVTGDTVLARVTKRTKRGGRAIFEGRILEILERGRSRFVGQLVRDEKRWLVWPDGNTLHVPIFVQDVRAKVCNDGDQVVVEILQYPTQQRPATGVIIERLGPAGTPDVDLLSVIRQYHLPDEWPDEVLAEARHVTDAFELKGELARREDRREQTTITIDPVDARDFDDAIELTRHRDGTYELGIHIADVAHFVRLASSLDTEARLRGNSVYFLRHVLPMLPELLSNGLCSLQQDQDRLTKSVFIRYDSAGRVLASRVANCVIRSRMRLSYEQASGVLAGRADSCPPEVTQLLKHMERLAKIIQKRRTEAGMLVLELPEVELSFDDDGNVIDAAPAELDFTHTIIEMFMLEANEAVARLLVGLDVPLLRRIHPDPDSLSQQNVSQFIRLLGHKVPRRLDRRDLQRLLDSVRGRPESYAINLAVLRSMTPAEYSPQTVGHYALASDHYCHFTSPIRRYPDLTVHRLIEMHLQGQLATPAQRSAAPDHPQLLETGKHCSYTERRAEQAERELRLIRILQLLSRRIGQVIEGVVTGVTNFGLFVQSRQFLVDGLVRFADMPDDWWEVDERTGAVVGQRTGLRFQLGDLLNVKIIKVNISARQLDLALDQPAKDRQQPKPTKKQSKKRAPRR